MKTGCIILAGGTGQRIGGEKAGVDLLGKSLLQRAISNLEFLQTEIVVVLAPGSALPRLPGAPKLKVVHDAVAGKGPLAGLLAGLENSEYQYNVVLACDMPLVNKELVRHMISVAPGFAAVVPRFGRDVEPLQAVYSRECLPNIETLLASGRLNASALARSVNTHFIDSLEIARFDPERLSFMNINTPADLKAAEGILKRGQD